MYLIAILTEGCIALMMINGKMNKCKAQHDKTNLANYYLSSTY